MSSPNDKLLAGQVVVCEALLLQTAASESTHNVPTAQDARLVEQLPAVWVVADVAGKGGSSAGAGTTTTFRDPLRLHFLLGLTCCSKVREEENSRSGQAGVRDVGKKCGGHMCLAEAPRSEASL